MSCHCQTRNHDLDCDERTSQALYGNPSEFAMGDEMPLSPVVSPELVPSPVVSPGLMPLPYVAPLMPSYPPELMSYPGMLPGMMPALSQDEAQKIQDGKNAYDQLTTKHSIFRTPILQKPGPIPDSWYSDWKNDLEELLKITISVSTQVIAGMINYLISIDPNRAFTVHEMVELVHKLVLHEKVSFPEIELPARVLSFLKSSLKPRTPTDNVLNNKKTDLRNEEFQLIQELQAARIAVDAASKRTYVSTYLQELQDAQGHQAQVERDLAQIRSELNDVIDQISAAQNVALTDEQILLYILDKNPNADLQNKYDQMKYQDEERKNLLAALQAPIDVLLKQRAPLVDNLTKIRQAELQALALLRAGSGSQSDYDSLVQQRISAYNLVTQIENQLQDLYNQRLAKIKARPDLFPDANDKVTISDLLTDILKDFLANQPEVLIRLSKNILADKAQDADNRMKALLATRAEDTAKKEEAYNAYFKAKAEAELDYYQKQLKVAQDSYNQASDVLSQKQQELKDLQDTISNNIQRLGGPIGWACHSLGIGETQMNQLWFIKMILTQISQANGKYDEGVFDTGILGITKIERFWKETDVTSWDLASQTLMMMQSLESKKIDFDSGEGKRLRDQIANTRDWMDQLQKTYDMTTDKINTPEYAKAVMKEFNLLPEEQLSSDEDKAIATQIRDIHALIQYDQQKFDDLINSIETEMLQRNGIYVPDLTTMVFDDKKLLWHGTIEFLTRETSTLPKLVKDINELVKLSKLGPLAADQIHGFTSSKNALLKIIGSQMIYRALSKDDNFQLALGEDAEAQAKEKLDRVLSQV